MPDASGTGVRLTIGRKLGAAFALLALILLTIGAVVTLQVHGMLENVDSALEEQGEVILARDIERELRAFVDQIKLLEQRSAPGAAESQILAARLAELFQTLERLELAGSKPSEELHEEAEQTLYPELRRHLESLRAGLETQAPTHALRPLVADAFRAARAIHDEDRDASAQAEKELARRGRSMRAVVVGSSLAALAVLGAALWIVRRTIVEPIRQLKAGAKRLGGGELGLRLTPRSEDEIGDLTRELNHMAAELEAMRGELEVRVRDRTREFVRAARLAGLGTLAAGVAHEINNPLASIASCAEGLEHRLRTQPLSREEQLEYLQTIAREAYRAHEITSRLLEFARAEPGSKSACDVEAIARELERFLHHRMERAGVALELECGPGLPEVLGNASELKQVLLNLLENALDASPRGGRIRLRCAAHPAGVELSVEDQGPGIAAADLERIFDPFFSTKAPGRGTGLGLAIVHRIVADHGGHVEVDPGGTSGCGARFAIVLPAAVAQERA
jgi:signal transduction histidine kinase